MDEFSESHSEHKSIEGMRTSCSPDINEVSVQVKYKNKRYRSRYDIHVNLCQQNLDEEGVERLLLRVEEHGTRHQNGISFTT